MVTWEQLDNQRMLTHAEINKLRDMMNLIRKERKIHESGNQIESVTEILKTSNIMLKLMKPLEEENG